MIIYVYIFVIYIDFISLFIGKRRFIPALLRSLFIYYIDTVIYDVLMKLASSIASGEVSRGLLFTYSWPASPYARLATS